MRFAARLRAPLGYLRPYDPRFCFVVAPTKIPYMTPKLFELWDKDILKALPTLADSGTELYSCEDGSGLYLCVEAGDRLCYVDTPAPE